jgi:hypothetical protein
MSEAGQTCPIDRSTVRSIMKPCAEFVGSRAVRYELRFVSLTQGGRDFVFPCDADGHVNIAQMSERSRSNYFYARKAIGRAFSVPATVIVG